MALRLAKAFGTSPELWLRLQIARDLWEARRTPVVGVKCSSGPDGRRAATVSSLRVEASRSACTRRALPRAARGRARARPERRDRAASWHGSGGPPPARGDAAWPRPAAKPPRSVARPPASRRRLPRRLRRRSRAGAPATSMYAVPVASSSIAALVDVPGIGLVGGEAQFALLETLIGTRPGFRDLRGTAQCGALHVQPRDAAVLSLSGLGARGVVHAGTSGIRALRRVMADAPTHPARGTLSSQRLGFMQ